MRFYFQIRALLVAATLSVGLLPVALHAQSYPSKPVRIIVAGGTGTGGDILGRLVAQNLSESWGGHSVFVENIAGAGGVVGTRTLARAAADGHTLGIISVNHAINPAFYPLPYDMVKDFKGVISLTNSSILIVADPGLQANSVADLVKLARAQPGTINYGSTGNGALVHLVIELFMQQAGIKMTHIPYKTSGQLVTDLLAGRTQLILGGLVPLQPYIQAGRLRPIAVTTAKRWHSLPDVAAMAEALPGYEVESWFGIVMPKGVPPAVLERMNAAANKILRDPDVKKNLEGEGMAIVGGSTEQFSKRIRNDHTRWVKLVREAKLKGE